MSTAERAHAHHVNVTALNNANLSPELFLDTLGLHQNASTIVEGHKVDFKEFFKSHWLDSNFYNILTFHNSAGIGLNNATLAADPVVLLPVQDGVINQCRPADVRYVRLQLLLDFRPLCPAAGPTDNTMLRQEFYVELPQESNQVSYMETATLVNLSLGMAKPTSAP
jgi:hypothetical protein